MKQPLAGRVALVTGASRGLGLEIALRLAADGASLALAARDREALESASKQVMACYPDSSVQVFRADFTVHREVDALADWTLEQWPAIDILINNAAIQGPIGRFEQADWLQWKAVFDVNVFAPARLAQRLVPTMRRQRSGKIINISGGGATSPRPDFSAYAASKCALVRLTETLAEELRDSRIDVNAVSPGAMNTRMLDEVIAAGPDAARHEYESALKRQKQGGAPASRAAGLVAWLASPASDGITGKLISAVWDDWERLDQRRQELEKTELFTLRRVS
ncbi:MAG TPA: SDR family oxidoreductase [Tepidisphaeraceae bacterium]|nr:SDR family oxidoreductase [Tepidisphaeraceae bacterium]